MRNHSDKSKKKTALITGASSGIGYELTKLFARNGYDLVMVARDALRLERIADELERTFNIGVLTLSKDLSQQTSANEIYRELETKDIDVDILVNDAGFNVFGPFSETDSQEELQMIQVNMVTLTQLTKIFLPGMLKRNSGKILNLASTASFTPGPGDAVYCATKAYVLSFSEAIAEEVKGTGVTVTALCPGPTQTEFAERARMTDTKIFNGSLSSAPEVARGGYRALMRGDRVAVIGLANKLLVFSLRFWPRGLVTRVAKTLLAKSANTAESTLSGAH
jgi:short-subunit dehydrogenase